MAASNSGNQSNIPINITPYLEAAGLDSEDKIIDISLGMYHSSALSQNGEVLHEDEIIMANLVMEPTMMLTL